LLLLVLLALLTAFALINGWHHLQDRLTQTAQAAAETRASISAAAHLAAEVEAGRAEVPPARDPRSPGGFLNAHLVSHALKPPLALSALTIGQSDLYPAVLRVSAASRDLTLTGSEYENPQRLLAGRFDAAFIVIHVLPLLLLALTYNLISADRERGTLPLVLLGRVGPGRLVGARAVMRGGLVLGGFIAIVVTGFLLVGGAAESGRLAVWLAVAAAYGAFWVALAAAVALRGGSSATNALALTGAWLLFTVVTPALVSLAAKTVYPAPSRLDFILARRAATDASVEKRSALLAAYFEDHPELAPKDAPGGGAPDPALVQQVSYEEQERQLAPVRQRFAEQLARQQALVDRLKFLSPALLAQAAFNDLAGTGLARHQHFLAQAGAQHDALRAFFQPRILAKETFHAFDSVPAYVWQEESGAAVFRRTLPGLIALVLATLALAGWALARSRVHSHPQA